MTDNKDIIIYQYIQFRGRNSYEGVCGFITSPQLTPEHLKAFIDKPEKTGGIFNLVILEESIPFNSLPRFIGIPIAGDSTDLITTISHVKNRISARKEMPDLPPSKSWTNIENVKKISIIEMLKLYESSMRYYSVNEPFAVIDTNKWHSFLANNSDKLPIKSGTILRKISNELTYSYLQTCV